MVIFFTEETFVYFLIKGIWGIRLQENDGEHQGSTSNIHCLIVITLVLFCSALLCPYEG